MELEQVRLQTTWNDAAGSINNNYAKIADAIAQLKADGGGGGGGADIDLTDYATKVWVTANYAPLTSVQGFENRIGGLEGAVPQLNARVETVESKVATLNEYVVTGENNLLDMVNAIEQEYATMTYVDNAIDGIDISAYLLKADLTKSRIQSTLGISDWALAATKPSYTAAEMGALSLDGTSKMQQGKNIVWSNTEGYEDIDVFSNGLRLLGYNTSKGNYGGGIHIGTRYGWQLMTKWGENPLYYRSYNINSQIWRDWETLAFVSDIPTKLSQLTDDVVAGKYLPLSGGIINTAATTPLNIKNTQSNPTEVGIRFMYNNDSKGWIGYSTQNGTTLFTYNGNHKLGIKDDGTAYVDSNTLIHSGNIKDQYVAGVYDSYNPLMKITFNYAGDAVTSNPTWLTCWNGYTLSYVSPDNVKAGSATKLATPRSIWGKSFDGTGNITGHLWSDTWRIVTDATFDGAFFQSKNYDGTSNAGNIYLTGWDVNTLESFNVRATNSIFSDNVGIGTSPTERLDVSGNIKASGDITANKFIGSIRGNIIYDNGTDEGHFIGLGSNGVGVKGLLNYVYGNFPILFYTNGFERMRIGEYVGIGTTSPTEKLDVAGNVKASGNINATSITINGVTITASNGSITVNGNVFATGDITGFV